MAGLPITAAEVEQARRLLADDPKLGRVRAAKALGVTLIRADNILRRAKGENGESASLSMRDAETAPIAFAPDVPCDEIVQRYKDFIGWKRPVRVPERKPKADGWVKSIVINDPHSPYQAKEAIQKMVAAERHDTDRLIINGDLSDLQNWSRHDKFGQRFTPVDEITETQALLTFLSESFPEVVILEGNHDARWLKYLVRQGVDAAILDAFRLLCPNFDSPLHLYAKGLPNVRITEARRLGPAEFGWFYQQGDAICTHAEVYSKIPNRAVGNVIHWLQSYALPQALVAPFKVVIQGHTHQAGVTWNDFGVWGVENGCMCLVGDYCGSPQLRGAPRPWMKGYTQLWQRNGVTDIERLRFVPVGF